jgi:hypothetical protein
MFLFGGRALDDREREQSRAINQTPNAEKFSMGVRLWGLSSMAARGRAQIVV